MTRPLRVIATIFSLFIFSFGLSKLAHGTVLIALAEARLPDDNYDERDPFPGPKIILELPPSSTRTISSPFHLKLKFEPRGAKIDLSSIYVIYKKLPAVDLTERVRHFASSSGIDMPDTEVPSGIHRIVVEIKDAGGLPGHLEFVLNVASTGR